MSSKYPKPGSLNNEMKKFLPKYTLEGRKINKYESRVVKEWKQLGGYTPLDAQQTVIENCKFWFPWYGGFVIIFFFNFFTSFFYHMYVPGY